MTTTLAPPTRTGGAPDREPPATKPPRLASRASAPGVLAPTVASGIAVLLSGAALLPLFGDADWMGTTILTVVAVVAAGGIATWLRAPLFLVPVVQAGVLFGVLVARFTTEAPLGFIPSPDAMRDLRAVLSEGLDAIDRYAPPVPLSDGLVAVAALGMGCVALTVFVLEVSLRVPTAAGIPLVAVYVVPSFVLNDGSPWWAFALVVAGWLVLLATDERLNLAAWGRLLRRADRTTSPLGAVSGTAVRLGVVAVVLALALPVVIPGLTDAVLGRISSGDGSGEGEGSGSTPDTVTIDPLVSLRRDLLNNPDVTVLQYTTTASKPSYLRMAVLVNFDGTTWKPPEFSPEQAVQASTGTLDDPSPSNRVVQVATRHYDITSERLGGTYLPVPAGLTALESPRDWYVDRTTGTVVGFGGTKIEKSDAWGADVLDVSPSPADLDAAPELSAQEQADLAEGTPIPASVTQLAKTITRDARTKHDMAVAIQDYFLDNFRYSTKVVSDTGPMSASFLEQFLNDKVGYCEQFAATMALMARAVGIPSRVVVGFTPGTRSGTTYTVSAQDAHAWPELFFTGIGWVRFEPTPRSAGDGGQVIPPPYAVPAAGDPGERPTARPGTTTPDDRRGGLNENDTGSGVLADDLTTATSINSADLWRLRGIAAFVLVAGAALLVPAAVRGARRRRRLAGTAGVEDAWTELGDTLRDLGLPWSTSRTPRQAATDVIDRQALAGDAADATRRIARATEQARYAPHPAPASHVADDVTTVRHALWRRAHWRTRLRARFWPRSLRRTT